MTEASEPPRPAEHRRMSRKAPALTDFRRIVVKVGSSLLVDSGGGRLKDDWLASLAEDIAALHGDKRDVLVVSSGAIALGRAVLKLPKGPLKLEDSQAAAAVGQIALARTWARGARPPRHHRRPGAGDACRTPRSAGAISTPAPPSTSCSNGARCR